MTRIVHRISACLLGAGLLLGSAPVLAAEDTFVVASVEGQSGRFLPLKPVRDGVVRVETGLKRAPLRSDMQATRDGFMRIDRKMLKPQQNYRSVRVTDEGTAAGQSRAGVAVVRPQNTASVRRSTTAAPTADDAITDLFAAAPSSTSFRDALTGQGSSRARHAWPVPMGTKQQFTSGYGVRKDPFHGRPAFHGGIDIAAAVGTPILASAEGVVSKVENGKGLGKYVAVQHRDGTESYYGHLSAQNVRVGQRVMQGQKVGELGSSGRSTGPHLDYRIKKNGQTFNPMAVLRAPRAVVASR